MRKQEVQLEICKIWRQLNSNTNSLTELSDATHETLADWKLIEIIKRWRCSYSGWGLGIASVSITEDK